MAIGSLCMVRVQEEQGEYADDARTGEMDLSRSRRVNESSLSLDKVRGFLSEYDRREQRRGDGVLLYGNKWPLRSPRPDKGVGTRFRSRSVSVGGGIGIGAGLQILSGRDGCEVVLVVRRPVVEKVGARPVIEVGVE